MVKLCSNVISNRTIFSIIFNYMNRHCHGVFIIFDLNDPSSLDFIFDNLDKISNVISNCPAILIGNKSDKFE